jgi:UDP-GlcNAc:undecaprenyl-phosphate GlcNAc-1-phosphate transferase
MDSLGLATFAIYFLPAAVLAALLSPLARRAAARAALLAPPEDGPPPAPPRPYGGGLAILLALAVAIPAVGSIWHVAGSPLNLNFPMALRLGLGAILFFVIGLADDRFRFRPVVRLALQCMAAGVAVIGFDAPHSEWLWRPFLSETVGILGIVLVVNAINLFDHADGLAATFGAVAASALAVGQIRIAGALPPAFGTFFVPPVAAALAGALAGFLVFNVPRARFLLGNAGSYVVGYVLAALVLEGRYYFSLAEMSPYVVFVPLAVLAVPLIDMACVLVSRVARFANPFIRDAGSGLADRMAARGWRPRAIVLFVAAASLATGAASIAMYDLEGPALLVPWAVVAGALAAMLILRRPAAAAPAPASPGRSPATPGQSQTAVTPQAVARLLRRAVVILGAAGLLVLPQFTPGASFIGPRGLAGPGPVMVLLVGLVFWLMPVLVAASWAAEGRARVVHPWLAVPVGLFLAGAAISTVFAVDKSAALVRAAELSGLWVGSLALVQAIRSDAERRFLLAVLVAAALVAALVALEQTFQEFPARMAYFQDHRPEILASQGIDAGSAAERAFLERLGAGAPGAMAGPGVLATMLVLGILIACGLAREKWTEASRSRRAGMRPMAVGLLAVAAVCAAGLAATKSRSGAAALLVGLGWLAVAWRVRRRGLRVALYAAPLVAVAGFVALAAAVDHPAIAAVLGPLRYRPGEWLATWDILRSHGVAGVGLENFGLYYPEFRSPSAPANLDDPHHLVLSLWSSLGLAGAAAGIALAAVAVATWLRAGKYVFSAAAFSSLPTVGEGAGVRGCAPINPSPGLRPPSPTGGEGTTPNMYPGEAASADKSLAWLLAPVAMVAGPTIVAYFVLGMPLGVGAMALALIVTGLASAEEPRRMAVPDRPLGALGVACIVALAAFLLMEQAGAAIQEAPTVWAMLVVLGVSLGAGRPACQGDAGASPAPRPAGEGPAAGAPSRPGRAVPGRFGSAAQFALMVLGMALIFSYVKFIMLPVGQEETLLAAAGQATGAFECDEALRAAGEANPLAWEPALVRGRMWQREASAGPRGPGQAISLERAMEAFREALARQPRLGQAWLGLADCYLAPEGADKDPDLSGVALAEPEALADALGCLQEASRLAPTDAATHVRMAEVLDRMDQGGRALAEFRQALDLDDRLPAESRHLASDARRAAEQRAGELEESLAGQPAMP